MITDPYRQLQINGQLNNHQMIAIIIDLDNRIKELEKHAAEERKVSSTRRTSNKDAGKSLPST